MGKRQPHRARLSAGEEARTGEADAADALNTSAHSNGVDLIDMTGFADPDLATLWRTS